MLGCYSVGKQGGGGESFLRAGPEKTRNLVAMNIDDLIVDLQSLPDSALDRVRGYVAALKESNVVEKSSEERFWDAIDKLEWEAHDEGKGTDDDVVAPLIRHLASLSVAEIYDYDTELALKLQALDGPAYHEASKAGHSADRFLYARCAVVANGREYYYAILNQPGDFPDDLEFQRLLYCANEAYEQKTGEEYNFLSGIIYESFFNDQLWGEGATFAKLGVTPEDVKARATPR